MKVFVAAVACLLSALNGAGAWGLRGQPGGPPGHYGGRKVHGNEFQPDIVLHVTYANQSFGCQSRASVLINGTSPGPTIRLKSGRRSWIRVYNDMEDYNTTIHWHGLSQRMGPFNDGTPQASQWPTAPGCYFDYEIFPLRNESGTYFYHSHVGFQAVSSTGALIIEDLKPNFPYAYDEEREVFITDYFSKEDHTIEQGLIGPPFTWSGETNAVLINGVGVAINQTATGDGTCKLPVIDVEPGKTYRMRFVGAMALSMVQFAIEGHEFPIIEADGSYTKPHVEKFMQVSSGQRFSVLFKTKTVEELGDKTDYLIQFETKDRPAVYRGYGVLRYSGGKPTITSPPAKPPLTLSNETYAWAEYALEPLVPNDFPTAAEVTRRLEIDSRQLSTQTVIWGFNDLQWNETTVPYPGDTPYLVNLYLNGPEAMPNYTAALENNGWDPESYTFVAKLGEVIEIIWTNTGSFASNSGSQDYHPLHGHGGRYFDIGSGNGTYNATENEEKLKNYNPVLRDTTNLYRYVTKTVPGIKLGWRGWRLRVTDPGVWMMHCHILQHMVMGMQSVWVMGNYSEITRVPLFDAQNYLTYNGDAYGNATHHPVVNHFFDDADEV